MTSMRETILTNLKTKLALALGIALLSGSLIASSPAQATDGLDANGNGTLACTTGFVTVISKVVQPHSLCTGTVTIPKTVTAIGSSAFKNATNLVGITFENGSELTSIGSHSFEASGLTQIIIPEHVIGIRQSAFYQASQLTSVTFAGDVLNTVDTWAFNGATSLAALTLPASVRYIGGLAFEHTSPNSIFTFQGNAPAVDSAGLGVLATGSKVQFYDGATGFDLTTVWPTSTLEPITGLPCFISGHATVAANVAAENEVTGNVGCTGSVVIPSDVIAIANDAFSSATSLTAITFAAGSQLGTIGVRSFKNSGLTSIQIPGSVAYIETGAFQDSSKLTSVTFASSSPQVSLFIEDYAFNSVAVLQSITLPSRLQSIGQYAFKDSATLREVTFAGSAPRVGVDAFVGVRSNAVALISASATGFGPIVSSVATAGASGDTWNLLKVVRSPDVACSGGGYVIIEANMVTRNVGCAGSLEIPSNVTSIGYRAFWQNITLSSVTFAAGSQLTTIDHEAFYQAESLTQIAIPETVTRIGDSAFGYSGLTAVTVPASVSTLGAYAFRGASHLTAINVAPTSAELSSDDGVLLNKTQSQLIAFPMASANTNYTIPETVNVIENYAFMDAANLTTLTIPPSVTSIGEAAFSGAARLTSAIIPEGIRSIGQGTFSGAVSLTSVSLPSTLTSIGMGAFLDASSLTSITIPVGVTAIAPLTFQGTSSLINVAIPSSVTSIGAYAFRDARSLTSISIPAAVTTISGSAFEDASQLIDVTFEGNAPTSMAGFVFNRVSAGARANITNSATGFGDGPTWNGLTIVRAAAPYVAPTSGIHPPVITPPVVVPPKPVAKQIALSTIVTKVLPNGVPVLKGRSASKQVQFAGNSARLDATDWATLRKLAAAFKGKQGQLILVGFVSGKGQTKGSAQKVAAARAKNVAMALVGLRVDFEIGYAGFGARNKVNPTAIDNRVDFRWFAAE